MTWVHPATLLLPIVGEVHIRRFSLDRGGACADILSPEERARADRFRFEQDRQRWRAGRAALRRTLGAYLDTVPDRLRFETGPWGKPGLLDCPLRFNVSHSGDTALMAFAWQQEVGIDVERLRFDFPPDALAAQAFSAEERAWLGSAPPEQRHAAFLTLWTAKEAYVKARGAGLSHPLSQLTLTPLTGEGRFQVQDAVSAGIRQEMSVCRIPVESGYVAALAVEGQLAGTRYFEN